MAHLFWFGLGTARALPGWLVIAPALGFFPRAAAKGFEDPRGAEAAAAAAAAPLDATDAAQAEAREGRPLALERLACTPPVKAGLAAPFTAGLFLEAAALPTADGPSPAGLGPSMPAPI